MKVITPDIDEVKSCLNKLKNGKASNDIPTIFLKHASENVEFLTELTKLYNNFWFASTETVGPLKIDKFVERTTKRES